MTETVDWSREAHALKNRLDAIEEAARQGRIPSDPISIMRRAIDDCRTALWAAAIASTEHAGAATILAARFTRVQEMCDRIVEEVGAGRIWTGTPGLGRFVAALDETERRVRPLLAESSAAQSG